MIAEDVTQALENALLKLLRTETIFTMPYEKRIDASAMVRKAYELVDYERVIGRMKELLEQELAEKIVNKIVTEMGTDVKNLMSNATVREDLKFFMRKGVEEVLQKAKLNEAKGSA